MSLSDPGEALADEGIVYADYQSAKPVDPRVVEAMLPYFTEKFGNASSLHAVGDVATAALEEARARVAAFIGAEPRRDHLHRRRHRGQQPRHHRLCAAQPAQGRPRHHQRGRAHLGPQYRQVPREERLSGDARAHRPLRARLAQEAARPHHRRDDPRLGAWASNEIGTVQPIAEIAEMLAGTGIVLHSDAVAAEGLVPST